LKRSAALFAEALGLLREIGDNRSVAVALNNLGRVAHARGEAERALAALRESVVTFERLGDLFGVASALEGLAVVLSDRSESEAARLFAAAAALRERTGTPREASDQLVYDRHLAATRSALGDDAFKAAWAAGAVMPLEQAVAEAVEAANAPG
jgi:tetratricopeptide (TPR) repeat protein